MASSIRNNMLVGVMIISSLLATCLANFNQDFDLTWGDHRAKIFNNGQLLSLSLDKISGSGFQSKKEYLFGRIDMQLKLVAGNSAGTVTAYYVTTSFFPSNSFTLILFLSCSHYVLIFFASFPKPTFINIAFFGFFFIIYYLHIYGAVIITRTNS